MGHRRHDRLTIAAGVHRDCDAVTVAARLAAAAGPGEILLAERTQRLLEGEIAIEPHGEMSVVGRRQPVTVFAIVNRPMASAQAVSAKPPRSTAASPDDSIERVSNAPVGAELLAGTPLFAELAQEELRRLAGRLRLRRFKKGSTIVRVDEPSANFFLIKTGIAKVTRALLTGNEAVISILGRGEFFGELDLLRGQGGNYTVVALQPTEVLVLARDVFLDCLQAHPSVARAAIALLNERVRRLGDQLEEAYTLELPKRLARQLVELGSVHGKRTDEGLVIDLPLTQSDLAGMVGASRQRVNRLLAEWQDRRLLRLGSYGRMTLLRPDTFTDLAPEAAES